MVSFCFDLLNWLLNSLVLLLTETVIGYFLCTLIVIEAVLGILFYFFRRF